MEQRRRFYTVAEANVRVPDLEKRFGEIASRVERVRALEDQVNDLEIAWGSKILEESCPERSEYQRYRKDLEDCQERIRAALGGITADGIEVKDLDMGLVDFYANRGGEVVFLCWRKGEREIAFWHTLQGGFAGRKPMGEF